MIVKIKFLHTKLAFGMFLVLAAFAGAVQAQDTTETAKQADDKQMEEVIVYGIRRSLMNSVNAKKGSEGIVEAVSAEDIGKLPDISIAESLARLPGLAAQRLNGRAQVISIRGLDPDFSTALLNGRQQVSTGDNRSVEFDQYPSELLSGALVYKTPHASLIGQGVAGTVDMQTIQPLAYGKKAIAANMRYEWNDMSARNPDADDSGPRYTLSYIDQFADDTIGIALGYASIDTTTQGERFEAWGYADIYTDNITGLPTWSGTDGVGDPNVYQGKVIGGAKPFVQSNTLERDSFMAVVEYQPNDDFSTTVDLFYSEFNEEQLLRGIELPLWWSSAQLQPGFTATNGIITSGTYTNVQGVIRSDAELRDAELFAIGWKTRFSIGDDWTFVADTSYSSAKRRDEIIENYSGYTGGPDTLSFNTGSKGTVFSSSVDYTDVTNLRIANLQGWGSDFVPEGGQKGYYKQPQVDDQLNQIRLSAERELELGFVKSVEFGINYETREKDKNTSPEYYLALPGGATEAPLPAATVLTDLSFLGINAIVGYDPIGIFRDGTTYELVDAVRADIYGKRWKVEEDVFTAYAQFGIDTEIGSMPLTGNIGLQVINVDQGSEGFSSKGNAAELVVVAISGGKTYTEYLPSLNLTLDLSGDKYVRLGLARTLVRPRMDDLRVSSQFSFDPAKAGSPDINFSPWSGYGGNAALEPWITNSFDVSFEQYFDDGLGYYAVAVFYKDLRSYVVNQDILSDFSGYPTGGASPKLWVGFINGPVNGDGGTLKGVELSVSLAGEMFADVLTGFGTTFSAAFTDSTIEPPNAPEQMLPGLSKKVYNLTMYYERAGFSARISGRQRGEFVGELAGFDAQRDLRIINEERIVDAQISYEFNSGSLDGLTILFQGNNLTDEPFITNDHGDPRRRKDYQSYGPTYAIGVSYKY